MPCGVWSWGEFSRGKSGFKVFEGQPPICVRLRDYLSRFARWPEEHALAQEEEIRPEDDRTHNIQVTKEGR